MAYLGLGANVYGKHEGQLPEHRLVLAPILIGTTCRLSTTAGSAGPGTSCAGRASAAGSEGEAAQAVRDGVTAVLDLTSEFAAPASRWCIAISQF